MWRRLPVSSGLLFDERLALLMDEGQNSSRARGIELQLQFLAGSTPALNSKPLKICGCNTAAYDFCNCGAGICAVCGDWSFHFQTYFCSPDCRNKAEYGRVA
jgi:hypothetical protein